MSYQPWSIAHLSSRAQLLKSSFMLWILMFRFGKLSVYLVSRQAYRVEIIRPMNQFSLGELSYHLQMCSGLFWSHTFKIYSCEEQKLKTLSMILLLSTFSSFTFDTYTRRKKNGIVLDLGLKQIWGTVDMVWACNLWNLWLYGN